MGGERGGEAAADLELGVPEEPTGSLSHLTPLPCLLNTPNQALGCRPDSQV